MKLLIFGQYSKFGLFITEILISLNYKLLIFFFRIFRDKIKHMLNAYLFPCSFHTKLAKTGPKGVCRQTKDIAIFRKDFEFMLIAQNSHFSLCVALNLGIMLNTAAQNNSKKENLNNLLMPYMLYFNLHSNYYISSNMTKNI